MNYWNTKPLQQGFTPVNGPFFRLLRAADFDFSNKAILDIGFYRGADMLFECSFEI